MSEIEQYSKFCEAAMLNKQHDPWVRPRKPGVYGVFLIIKCRSESWWYRDFVGIEFLGKIIEKKYGENEVCPVRLTNTKEVSGRDIPIGDLILL